MRLFPVSVLALLVSTAALAQGPLYDPDQLPVFHGKVAAYSLTLSDTLDGFILDSGMQVETAPQLSSELAYAVKPGDKVTIHGMKASMGEVVLAVSVTNDATGVEVSSPTSPWPQQAMGWFRAAAANREMRAQGRVKLPLYGADGKIDGAVLDDGTIIRLFPGSAQGVGCLAAGREIEATGTGLVSALGRVLQTRSIKFVSESPSGAVQPAQCELAPAPQWGLPRGQPPLLNPPKQTPPAAAKAAPAPTTPAPAH